MELHGPSIYRYKNAAVAAVCLCSIVCAWFFSSSSFLDRLLWGVLTIQSFCTNCCHMSFSLSKSEWWIVFSVLLPIPIGKTPIECMCALSGCNAIGRNYKSIDRKKNNFSHSFIRLVVSLMLAYAWCALFIHVDSLCSFPLPSYLWSGCGVCVNVHTDAKTQLNWKESEREKKKHASIGVTHGISYVWHETKRTHACILCVSLVDRVYFIQWKIST